MSIKAVAFDIGQTLASNDVGFRKPGSRISSALKTQVRSQHL